MIKRVSLRVGGSGVGDGGTFLRGLFVYEAITCVSV